jgi:hypothetical protein
MAQQFQYWTSSMSQKFSFISSSTASLKRECEFVNREGEKVELLCLQNKKNMVETVIDPKGKIFKPFFLKNTRFFYIMYKKDQWYLLK